MLNIKRLLAVSKRETLEIIRDPLRAVSNFLVPMFLMVMFGYGFTLDIENIPFVSLDFDNTQISRQYVDAFVNSDYYEYEGSVYSDKEAERMIRGNKARFVIEIPAGFGRKLSARKNAQVGLFIDGTLPFRAETIKGYTIGTHYNFLQQYLKENFGEEASIEPVKIKSRFWYNQAFESKFAFVPGLIAILLMAVPAIVITVSIAREKEIGTIINFYATPLSKLEFILGKQLVFVLVSFINFFLLIGLALFLFRVPIKGNFLMLSLIAFVYLWSTTSIGIFVSTFVKSQIASLLITLIITMIPSFVYSGLLTPVSSLPPDAIIMANMYPVMHFFQVMVGTFTKDLPLYNMTKNYLLIGLFFVVLTFLSTVFLRKQEK